MSVRKVLLWLWFILFVIISLTGDVGGKRGGGGRGGGSRSSRSGYSSRSSRSGYSSSSSRSGSTYSSRYSYSSRSGSSMRSYYARSSVSARYSRVYSSYPTSYYYHYYSLYFYYSGSYAYRTRQRPTGDAMVCVNYEANKNGTYLGVFVCPLSDIEPANFTACCGDDYAEYCCLPETGSNVAAIVVGVIIAVVVLVILIVVLIKYCPGWCRNKGSGRSSPEVHMGPATIAADVPPQTYMSDGYNNNAYSGAAPPYPGTEKGPQTNDIDIAPYAPPSYTALQPPEGNQPPAEGYPPQPTAEGYPPQPTAEGYPPQPTTEGYPPQPPVEGNKPQPPAAGNGALGPVSNPT